MSFCFHLLISRLELKDLEFMSTLGVGAFGRVRLVKLKPSAGGKVGPSDPKTYALKCLSKKAIVDSSLQDHVINEKSIMSELEHPFILGFFGAMQDEKCIYFLIEALLGGELFKVLRSNQKFSEEWCRFYSASVLLAFCEMHSKKIAYRDLKPENLVMDSYGYLKIVDFGLAKKIDGGKTWTLCGTPDYLAPEIILNEGHDWAVDYWAFGVLIYEMAAGVPPFYANDVMDVYGKILSGNVTIPLSFSQGLADLVKKLLKTYQSKRLGRTRGGTKEIMKHHWYAGFDWEALLEKRMRVPILPLLKNSEDTSNFDTFPEEDDASLLVSHIYWSSSIVYYVIVPY
jgi:serine/threonine protein kinase